jgi:hypothetical protein
MGKAPQTVSRVTLEGLAPLAQDFHLKGIDHGDAHQG